MINSRAVSLATLTVIQDSTVDTNSWFSCPLARPRIGNHLPRSGDPGDGTGQTGDAARPNRHLSLGSPLSRTGYPSLGLFGPKGDDWIGPGSPASWNVCANECCATQEYRHGHKCRRIQNRDAKYKRTQYRADDRGEGHADRHANTHRAHGVSNDTVSQP